VGAVRRVVSLILILGLLSGGCGNGGGNDQGISFRAVGLFRGERQESRCQVPTIDNAITDESAGLPLDSVFLNPGFPNSDNTLTSCRAFLLLENNLFNQAVVVDRIEIEYEIPGARISVPATDFPTGLRLLPANADPKTPNPFGKVNIVFAQLDGQLVPSRVVSFLRQNQPSLPALPYVMIIHIRARGRTDNGETMVSNETRYTIEWRACAANDPLC